MGELHERHSWRKERTKESVFHKINKEKSFDYRFTTRTFKILILLLIIGLFSLPVFGMTGKYLANDIKDKDPLVPIYYFCNTNVNLLRFQYRFASVGGIGCSNHSVALASNSTASSFAIDQQPIDGSSVAGHHAQMNFAFIYSTTSNNQPKAYVFLTTNKTAPLETLFYQPNNDKNVVLSNVIFPGTNTFSVNTYIRSLTSSVNIAIADNGCGGGGSVLICSSGTGQNTIGTTYAVYLTLNYTGVTSSQTLSSLEIGSAGGQITINTQYKIPAFPFGTTLYWGISQEPGPNNSIISFMDNPSPPALAPVESLNHWIFGIWNPPALVNPYLDSGGFVGMVQRGLTWTWNAITGGLGQVYTTITTPITNIPDSFVSVFISALTNIVALFTQSIRTVLNVVGSFFGIGNVGDSIINFFIGIGTFFISVVSGGFSILDELATEGNKIITAIINFFTNGLTIFNFINDFLNSMSGLWNIIIGGWNEFLHWYTIGSMSISYFLVLWYFFGIYQVYLDGIHGLKSWLDMSEMFLLSIFKAGYWFSKESFSIVLTIKQLVAGWV